jgi:hypothetical protein
VNAATKLGSFGVVLALVLAGGAGLGAALGPEPDDVVDAALDPTSDTATLPGLAVADQGYRFEPAQTVLGTGATDFRFRIIGPEGLAVRSFDEKHDKQLHLIVVSRDLEHYAHVHPELAVDGTWSTTLAPLAPGAYRVFADFQASGGPSLTLGVDVSVPGDYTAPARPSVSSDSRVDGFDARLVGDVTAGESTVVVQVTKDGAPAELQPYLGANGHLVAIRDGDLAYLHVHPEGDEEPGGVPFSLHIPSAGRYRLFFDFQVDGVVRTADFTVDVSRDAATEPDHGESSDEHGH